MTPTPTSTSLDDRGVHPRAALVFTLGALFVAGLGYAAVTATLGGWLFPHTSRGSLLEHHGRVVGSALVAQPFAAPQFFVPRPSAVGYDPRAAAGSNLGPNDPHLAARIAATAATAAQRDGVPAAGLPADLVTSSGSGLDPHLSPAAVALQVPRVARARRVDEGVIRRVVAAHTEPPALGFLGQPRVNVLRLNLALEALEHVAPAKP